MDDEDDETQLHVRRLLNSGGSSRSVHSIAETVTRTSTVASALKKLFNRDDNKQSIFPSTIPHSSSSTSLPRRDGQHHGESMKITDQIIEEVDEQLTKTSVTSSNSDSYIQSIYPVQASSSAISSGQHHSAPIDIPSRLVVSQSTRNFGEMSFFPQGGNLFSIPSQTRPKSPPATLSSTRVTEQIDKDDSQESINSASRTDPTVDQEEDEFEKLRIQREQEKHIRVRQKIHRRVSIRNTITTDSHAAPAHTMDTDIIIDQLSDTENTEQEKSSKEVDKADK